MSGAKVDKTAVIGKDVVLGDNIIIGPNVVIREGTTIGHNVIVYADTVIGEGVTVYDNAVLGRKPQGTKSLRRKITEDLPPLQIGNGCVVGSCAVLYRGTIIGSRVLIGDLASVREECEIGDDTLIARTVTINYRARIGKNVKIMDGSHITGDMVIEDDVFVAPGVITTNENSMGRDPERDKKRGGPYIKRGASIGGNASLLPKVVVGEYSVVACGAVVNHDIPAQKIAAGNPARVIKDVPPEWLSQGETKD